MKKMAITTLTQKGQATIPKNVREYLGVRPRDKVEFVIQRGKVVVRAVGSLEANFGRVSARNKPERYQKLREEFEETVAREQVKKS